MRTIDRGTNWGRRTRAYAILVVALGVGWALVQSSFY